CKAALSSAIMAGVKAFCWAGRFRVRTAMPAETSTSNSELMPWIVDDPAPPGGRSGECSGTQDLAADGVLVHLGRAVVEPEGAHIAEDHLHHGLVADADATEYLHTAVGDLEQLL